MSDILLRSPVAGWLTPLEETPDPVFADRMMGDGFAVDPIEGVIRAPADALVVSLPPTAHAVTLRLANGAELLIHVGIDTVALGGAGFEAKVTAGASVRTGEVLIAFDLDAVGRKATSLVTPMIAVSEGANIAVEGAWRKVGPGDIIGRISTAPKRDGASEFIGGAVESRRVRLDAAHGIHARPAARLASLLKSFSAEVRLVLGERSANARSTSEMLGLGAVCGSELVVEARGGDAAEAVAAAAGFIASGMGDGDVSAPVLAASPAVGGGVCAVAGIAIGKIMQLASGDRTVPYDGRGAAVELAALDEALRTVRANMRRHNVGTDIAEAHDALLDDPSLIAQARAEIDAGRSAAQGWRTVCAQARDKITGSGDRLLAERASDLLDVERQVIDALLGPDGAAPPSLAQGTILVTQDLLPSQFLALDRSKLVGICTAAGGPTSHVAVLAASANIPMLVAAGPSVLGLADGTIAVLDADRGVLEAEPDEARLAEVRHILDRQAVTRSTEAAAAHEECRTLDGERIELFANLASLGDADAAVAAGAEGCGLLRTEFLFLERETAPDEEEQYRAYFAIAEVLGERPLVVRTLDIGGDKPVAYLPPQKEENPALGCRGIRLSLAAPNMLETQLRAILRAIPGDRCRIMLPMIVDLAEYRQARLLLDRAAAAVGRPGSLSLGVMIETPAAAILADTIAAEADFLSIGTNDLTQYALACDRGNAAVSAKVDAFHPAVLRLIRAAGEGARMHGRWLGVCGGLASDPLAVAILIGLGVTELSATPAAIPGLKAQVRRLRAADCARLAERACAAASPAEVRAIAKEALA